MDQGFKTDFLLFAYLALNDNSGISEAAYKHLIYLMNTWKLESLVIRGARAIGGRYPFRDRYCFSDLRERYYSASGLSDKDLLEFFELVTMVHYKQR